MTSPYGRAMAQMASVFAELERAMIRERTRPAMMIKRGRRERISRQAPYGWDFGPTGRLVDNAEEQRVLALIAKLRTERKSLRMIATMLNELGIVSKNGGRWRHSSVVRILARTV